MITTINSEDYTKGTEQKNGFLYCEVNLVNFLNKDGRIVVTNIIGEKVTLFDELLKEEVESYIPLTVKRLSYSEEEIKLLIEGTGKDFNSPVTNLLISEINLFVDDIILKDIEVNPSNYFGITVDKWIK